MTNEQLNALEDWMIKKNADLWDAMGWDQKHGPTVKEGESFAVAAASAESLVAAKHVVSLRRKLSFHKSERDNALDYSEPHPVTEEDHEHNRKCQVEWTKHSAKAQAYADVIEELISLSDSKTDASSDYTKFGDYYGNNPY